MNRREAVFYLFRRIPRHFDSFQLIFSLFNKLSGRLRLVRSDCDWFDASETPHETPSMFMLSALAFFVHRTPFLPRPISESSQEALRSDSVANTQNEPV
jgi:hypothetical protein